MTTLIDLVHPRHFTVSDLRSVYDRLEAATAPLEVPPVLGAALGRLRDALLAAEDVGARFRTEHAPNPHSAENDDLRRAVSARLGWLYRALVQAQRLGATSEEGHLAASLLAEAFPQGLGAIGTGPFAQRAARIDLVVRQLQEPRNTPAVTTLGLTAVVARLAVERDAFAAAIAVEHAAVTGADIQAAVEVATEALLAVVVLAVALAEDDAGGAALRDAITWPYVDTLQDKAARYRARRVKAAAPPVADAPVAV